MTCAKVRYATRKLARQAARRMHPGSRMTAYRCPECHGRWHLTSYSAARKTAWRRFTRGER